MIDYKHAIRCEVAFHAKTAILIRSGRGGEFTDSAIESDGNGNLHINGYVWAGLLRRAVARIENGARLSQDWGKLPQNSLHISPLWTEATFIAPEDHDRIVNPGNRIDREWGAVDEGALYSDELAIPLAPIICRFTLFCSSTEESTDLQAVIPDLIWVIGQDIETIGGGWAYGFGRLNPVTVSLATLDLSTETGRASLWDSDFRAWKITYGETDLSARRPLIAAGKGWTRLEVEAGIADGQMLAIHSTLPPLTGELPADMPDTFVFTRTRLNNPVIVSTPVITGKAFRQAVLSREIERKLRSTGQKACLDTTDDRRIPDEIPTTGGNRRCLCNRCLWFGDTRYAGIVSVGDEEISDPVYKTVHRIELCEHSMQNIQLFSGEYMTRGRFTMKIIIDHARKTDCNPAMVQECENAITTLLWEMQPGNAPPGWYRLGATSTSTGQLTVHNVTSSTMGGEA